MWLLPSIFAGKAKKVIYGICFAPRVQLGPRLVPLAPLLRLLPRHRAQDVGPGPVPLLRPLRPPARRPLLWHAGSPRHRRPGHRRAARVRDKGEHWLHFAVTFKLFCAFGVFQKAIW